METIIKNYKFPWSICIKIIYRNRKVLQLSPVITDVHQEVDHVSRLSSSYSAKEYWTEEMLRRWITISFAFSCLRFIAALPRLAAKLMILLGVKESAKVASINNVLPVWNGKTALRSGLFLLLLSILTCSSTMEGATLSRLNLMISFRALWRDSFR